MPLRLLTRTACPFAATLLCGVAGLRRQAAHDPFSVYDGHDLLKVSACDRSSASELRRKLASASCRVLTEPGALILPRDGGCAVVQATCPPQAASDLQRHPGVELLADASAGEVMRRRGTVSLTVPVRQGANVELQRDPEAFYEAFRPYDDIMDYLSSLVRHAPDTVELVELEHETVEQRKIMAVRVRGAHWKPGAPRAIFTYTLHAREWISTMGGVYAAEQLIAKAVHAPEELDNMEVVVVPVSNPDGFVHSATQDRFWRKNKAEHDGCQGVDLNRNFNWQWSREYEEGQIFDSASCGEVFAGPHGASEPETKALQALVEEAPLTVHLDFHSCGGYILGPWSFMTIDHPRMSTILELGGALKQAIKSVEGSDYSFCTGNECLYPVAGDLPDYATALGALGFTIEMRPLTGRMASYDDFAPDPSQILPNAKENFKAVQVALQFARTGNTTGFQG